MATIFYIREGAKKRNVISSREVSVSDLINLYGATSSGYSFLKGEDSPDIDKNRETTDQGSDPAHVIVKIESNEVHKDTFPKAGFYRVEDATPEKDV